MFNQSRIHSVAIPADIGKTIAEVMKKWKD